MNRRQFVITSLAVGVGDSLSGCLSNIESESEAADIQEVEIWNSDESSHTFQVTLYANDNKKSFEQTAKLAGASKNHFTRQEFTNVPNSAAKIKATVDGVTAEKTLNDYETAVTLSVKYNRKDQLAIVEFV